MIKATVTMHVSQEHATAEGRVRMARAARAQLRDDMAARGFIMREASFAVRWFTPLTGIAMAEGAEAAAGAREVP